MDAKEKPDKIYPAHETFLAAALLAVTGGFLDAYTYLLRGGVFANAQTGNMVLLGVHIAEREYVKAVFCLAPITAFVIGVFVTEVCKIKFTNKEYSFFEHGIIVSEIIILLVVGFLPHSVSDGVVNVTIAFVCSLQVNSFRRIKGLTYASTMCTGNLRSGMEKLTRFLTHKEKEVGIESVHYFGIIVMFIIGAGTGTVLTRELGVKSVWCCCAILAVVLGIMGIKKEKAVFQSS